MAPFPSPTSTWHSESYGAISPSRPELAAKGKTVVITGGGTGIGAATARSFAVAGASPRLSESDIFTASTDVTNKDNVDASFDKFIGDGKIDVLISNAALTGPTEAIGDVDGEKFLASIQQNLAGSLFVAKAFLRHAAPSAVVVEINSSAAHVNFAPQFAAYSVAKWGVYRLWDSLGYGNQDLSVFHVQPGVVDTDMNKEAGGVKAMGFEDHVNLPADFNVWLASPEAQFLKGKFLWANWDVEELKSRAKELESGPSLSLGLVGWPFGGEAYTSGWNANA